MENIVNLISSLPTLWKIIFSCLFIFIWIMIYFFKGDIIAYIKSIGKNNEKSLHEHKLFTESSYVEYQIKMISLSSEKKTEMFKNLMYFKYNAIKKFSNNIIDNSTLKTLNNKQFYSLVLTNLTSIINEYNNNFKLKYGIEIYNMVMLDKEKGFNRIHEISVEHIKMMIEESFISEHVVFSTVNEKLDLLLDLYHISMKIMLNDIVKVYENYNGELDELL